MRSADAVLTWVAETTVGQAAENLAVRQGEPLSLEKASLLIDTALDNLDGIFKLVCEKYSHFALLISIQHHDPRLLVFEQDDHDGDSQEMFNTMSVVAFKFASTHENAIVRLTYRQYRTNVDRFFNGLGDALWEDLVILQQGVRVQRSLMNTRRTLHKGVSLRLGDKVMGFDLEYPDEVKDAIRVYENRARRTANALGWQGFFVPFAPLKNDSTFDFPLARIDWHSLRNWDGKRPLDPSPFVVTLNSLYFIFDASLLFERQIVEQFGAAVYITDFFAFLHAVWTPTVHRFRQGIAPCGWGYDFWSWRSFRNLISKEGPQSYQALLDLMWKYLDDEAPPVMESFTRRYWIRVYRKLLVFLSHNGNQTSVISHRHLYPAKFLFVTKQGIFAHLGLLPHFLHSIWSEFKMTGDIGSQKGPAFEQWAFSFLRTETFVPIWEPGKPFPFKVGRRVGTDIDLFFRKGSIGFVISCKSYSNTRETYDGHQRAVWLRWTEIQSWLTENDELADAMVTHVAEIAIPPDIRVLVPVVCVPQVEYLWDTSEHYMLTDALPRVLTPWELKEWIGSVTEESLQELPCVRTLS